MGYRIVRMTNELFEQFFAEGYTLPTREGQRLRVTKGLPVGAKLEAVSMDLYFATGQVALKFSHPSWEDTPPDVAIPEAAVEFAMEDSPAPDLTHPPVTELLLTEQEQAELQEQWNRYSRRPNLARRFMVLPTTPSLAILPAGAFEQSSTPAEPDAPHVVGG
jgi:hypothetical protein